MKTFRLSFKTILTVLVLVFFQPKSFSQTKNWSFTLTPSTTVQTATLGEYLYSRHDKNLVVSDLQWNQTLWGIGLNAQYRFLAFSVDGGFTYYLPFACGKMFDSDYNSLFKTNYASFTNTAPFAFDARLNARWNFSVAKFTVSPAIKTVVSYRRFNAINGSGYFGDASINTTGNDVPYNSPDAEFYRTYDIEYERLSVYTFAGVYAAYSFKRLDLFASFFVSPFTYTQDCDYHHCAPGDDQDYHSFCFADAFFTRFNFTVGMNLPLTERLSLITKFNTLFGPVARGDHVTNFGHPSGYGFFKKDSEFYKSLQDKAVSVTEFNFEIGLNIIF